MDPAITGALISTVGSFLGGGSPEDERRGQRHENEIATKRHPTMVRKGAEKAGFNPLTVLAANGSPASVSGFPAQGAPLASFAALGNAVQGVMEAKTNEAAHEEAAEQAKEQVERLDRQKQSDRAVEITRTVEYIMQRPALPASGPNNSERVAPLVGNQTEFKEAGIGPAASDDATAPARLPVKFFGMDLKPMSGSSDAAVAEDRYGEIAGEMIGLPSLAFDVGANVGLAASRQLYRGKLDQEVRRDTRKRLEQKWKDGTEPTMAPDPRADQMTDEELRLYLLGKK